MPMGLPYALATAACTPLELMIFNSFWTERVGSADWDDGWKIDSDCFDWSRSCEEASYTFGLRRSRPTMTAAAAIPRPTIITQRRLRMPRYSPRSVSPRSWIVFMPKALLGEVDAPQQRRPVWPHLCCGARSCGPPRSSDIFGMTERLVASDRRLVGVPDEPSVRGSRGIRAARVTVLRAH